MELYNLVTNTDLGDFLVRDDGGDQFRPTRLTLRISPQSERHRSKVCQLTEEYPADSSRDGPPESVRAAEGARSSPPSVLEILFGQGFSSPLSERCDRSSGQLSRRAPPQVNLIGRHHRPVIWPSLPFRCFADGKGEAIAFRINEMEDELSSPAAKIT
jgi:hypothetical protein